MKKILLTGATGFVGQALVAGLLAKGWRTKALVRQVSEQLPVAVEQVVGELTEPVDCSSVEVVIHAAARAHIMGDTAIDSLTEFRKVNVVGTLNLARQAAEAGVKRFIFISSIGVNGNINTKPFTADDTPNPAEPYAQTKWEAEQGLHLLARETGMALVIIRPPLVYGADAPGNFGSLVRWVEKGLPLPLGAIHNKRSLVGLDNLVDLIITCIDHPAAANQVFLAGDGEDLSTSELLRGVAKAMGKPSRLIPVPIGVLKLGATLLGKKAVGQRLLGSLQVDIAKTREVLGWAPPFTVAEGLKQCFREKSA